MPTENLCEYWRNFGSKRIVSVDIVRDLSYGSPALWLQITDLAAGAFERLAKSRTVLSQTASRRKIIRKSKRLERVERAMEIRACALKLLGEQGRWTNAVPLPRGAGL